MKLHVEWSRPISLRDARHQNMIYGIELEKLPATAGVYIFGRRFSKAFEALYVRQAGDIRDRVKGQLNNLHLMQHIKNARNGKRILLAGRFVRRPGQQPKKCLSLIEQALIRYFLSEGHNLVNKQGTRLYHHKIASAGRHPKRFFPRLMYLEKTKGTEAL